MRRKIVTTTYENALDEAFPAVNAGVRPYGSRVLVQIRSPKKKSAGGIIIDTGSRDTEKWNTQIAKVVAIGPLAFHNRDTMQPWPEGAWAKVGDYIRVAKYGGDRWEVPLEDNEAALFVMFNDLDLLGEVIGDPLAIRAFI
jgi:co-chaperonin GroES (HSP10)